MKQRKELPSSDHEGSLVRQQLKAKTVGLNTVHRIDHVQRWVFLPGSDNMTVKALMILDEQFVMLQEEGIPHVTQLGINILQLHGFACSQRPAFFLSHEGHIIFRLTLSLGFALAACTQHQGTVKLPLLPAHSIAGLQAFEESYLLYIFTQCALLSPGVSEFECSQ